MCEKCLPSTCRQKISCNFLVILINKCLRFVLFKGYTLTRFQEWMMFSVGLRSDIGKLDINIYYIWFFNTGYIQRNDILPYKNTQFSVIMEIDKDKQVLISLTISGYFFSNYFIIT